jgi:hypothetical protein
MRPSLVITAVLTVIVACWTVCYAQTDPTNVQQPPTAIIRGTKLAESPTNRRATPSEEAHALIGTWRVVEFADIDKDGRWVYLFGEHHRLHRH